MVEWAQLRADPTLRTGLERGRWYRVEARDGDGVIRVLGPDATAVPLHQSLLRLSDQEPDFITRVQAAAFQVIRSGTRMAELSYYGVCPSQHHIKRLGAADLEALCLQCNRTYRVEDELHS
jgi:hypothetical protein